MPADYGAALRSASVRAQPQKLPAARPRRDRNRRRGGSAWPARGPLRRERFFRSRPGSSQMPSVIDPDRSHLDCAIAMARAGNPCRDAKRGIEILGLDQIVTAKLLARFRERAVRGHDFSLLDAHGGRGRGRPQAVAGLEVAALDDVLGKSFKLVRHLLARCRVELGVFGLVRIDHQQILHVSHSSLFGWIAVTSSRTARGRNDTFRINYFWAAKQTSSGLTAGVPAPMAMASVGRTAAPAIAERRRERKVRAPSTCGAG